MEIDKAIRESEDTRLKAKYNNALFVIQSALSLYSIWEAADTRNLFRLRSSFGFTKDIEEVAFSFNGGKDSTVLLHLLRAGYFLYRSKQSDFNADLTDGELGFPIRTIYFESPSAFPEINSFTHDTASTYHLQLDIIRLDFKSGLEALLKEKPIKAIFLGVRIGDPTAVGQEQFSPSSPGWPAFMRVNPILDWSYRDVWAFLLTCKVQYCSLYDQGYTSIGSIYDTVQNSLLCINNDKSNENFRPAYLLSDGRLERAGRTRKVSRPLGKDLNNDLKNSEMKNNGMLTASVIAVGDEILFGTIEDRLGPILCRKLSSIGWAVSHIAVVRNDIDSVAEEVARLKSSNDMVFIHGGIGPLHSDITVAGIAKAFGVRMAPDEEFEEYLRHLIDDKCPGDHNEMAQLPEGITELLHHEKLRVPLIKCQNVIILSATNITELERQWDCLIDITKSGDILTLTKPFVSKHLRTTMSDVEAAQPLSKLSLEYPDLYIGCYRESRYDSLVICFRGKDQERVESAFETLCKKLPIGAFSNIN